jgi:hypothetical protein
VGFPTFPALDDTPRALRRLMSQERARANAASAAADLRELRRQREDADAFLARRARELVAQASSSGSTR